MQFIERLFGIAPDGGSGFLEILLLTLPLLLAFLALNRGTVARHFRGLRGSGTREVTPPRLASGQSSSVAPF